VGIAFDAQLERCAISDQNGDLIVRQVEDGAEVTRLAGFGVFAQDIQFSPDGRRLVARYGDARVSVWDMEQTRPILEVPMPPGPSGYGAQLFTGDNRRLIIGLGDRSLRTYDLSSGEEVKRRPLDAAVAHMALHADGRRLAICGWYKPALEVVDIETDTVLVTLSHPKSMCRVAWQPNGNYLAAVCGDSAIHIWDAKTWKKQSVLDGRHMYATFSHSGDLLASWAWDGSTRLWDPLGGKELVRTPGYGVQFGRDDRSLAYCLGWEIGSWEIAHGRECRSLVPSAAHENGSLNVAIGSNGRLLASTHDDGVRLWDLSTGKEVAMLAVGRCDAVFDPDGTSLIVNGQAGLQRWPVAPDAQGGSIRPGPPQVLRESPAHHYCGLSLEKDGRRLAMVVGGDEAAVIDRQQPSEDVRIRGHAAISNVSISPDARWIVSGTQFGSGIKVWDARTGELLQDLAAGNYGAGVFSPDGKWLVTSSHGEGTHVRETGSWKVRHQLTEGRCPGVAFSPDSAIVAVAPQPGIVVLYDPLTGRELVRLSAPHPLPISALSFSADGGLLPVACQGQQQVQLWDLKAIRRKLADVGLDW
jgi:WD40 repeat protein